MSPYERACRNALECQDACNFSGVLNSFFRDMEAVREHLKANEAFSPSAFANHPVALWYLDKLADLQGRPSWERMSEAYDLLQHAVDIANARDVLDPVEAA
jgi:hypothetical protein